MKDFLLKLLVSEFDTLIVLNLNYICRLIVVWQGLREG